MNANLERVNQACKHVRDANKDTISFKKLIGLTKTAFKKYDIDAFIRTKKDKLNLAPAEFIVNAYYDPEDDANFETSIEIIVNHNFDELDLFSHNQITDFLIQIYDATVHELRHRQQSLKRNYKVYSDHDDSYYHIYLKDPDEVDAYALSIAIELLRAMDKHRAKRYLSRITILAKMKNGFGYVSPNLKSYIDHFGLTKLTKVLAKKVSKHLETLDKDQIFV